MLIIQRQYEVQFIFGSSSEYLVSLYIMHTCNTIHTDIHVSVGNKDTLKNSLEGCNKYISISKTKFKIVY